MKAKNSMKCILTLLVCLGVLFGCNSSVSNIEFTIYESDNIRIISYRNSDSIRSFDINIFDGIDTFSYNRQVNRKGIIQQDGYHKNGKRIGPTNLYHNEKLTLRYTYKDDLPIFREDYFYNKSTSLLDSVRGSVIIEKKLGEGDLSYTVGGISFQNHQIDTLHSNYYLFSKTHPFVKSDKSDITFRMDVLGLKKYKYPCVFTGKLDSTNANLENIIDTTCNTTSPYIDFVQISSNFIGVLEIEGNLFFCDEKKDICYNRIPFYLPIYFMKPSIYDELHRVLYKIPWNEPW